MTRRYRTDHEIMKYGHGLRARLIALHPLHGQAAQARHRPPHPQVVRLVLIRTHGSVGIAYGTSTVTTFARFFCISSTSSRSTTTGRS
jgi:hypothetical protein